MRRLAYRPIASRLGLLLRYPGTQHPMNAPPLSIAEDAALAPPGASPSLEPAAVGSALPVAQLSPTRTTSSVPIATSAYSPSEVRALVLDLLPPAFPGAPPMPTSTLLLHLPTAVRSLLQQHPGGIRAYTTEHFPSDIVWSSSGEAVWRQRSHPKGQPSNTAPPPPPVCLSPSTSASPFARTGGDVTARHGKGPRTTMEILDAIVPFIPTFYVSADAVAATIPSDIQRIHADTTFAFFLKRFRHYVDIRTAHGQSEIRLRPDFHHPKRGDADAQHSSASRVRNHGDGVVVTSDGSVLRRPPRNSEANLVLFVVPRIPKEFTPLAEVLQDVSDIISRHPSFDPRLGVTGFFDKYPEYFQVVEGKIRTRPYRTAPNALDDLDGETSPMPAVFSRILAAVEAAAEGKSYRDEAERAAAVVSTGRLYALLSDAERRAVKEQFRSFPRFLRSHGRSIVVSPDSTKVYRFKPEYERCAETVLNQGLAMHAISPDDPILKIPVEMDAQANADWAIKELYDALPLAQCAALQDILTLVPTSVKEALPSDEASLVAALEPYPDYFLCWSSPDDPRVMMIQRAKVALPDYDANEIVGLVAPLIPQGGTTLASVMRRAPLPLQRYFNHRGLRVTLGELKDFFLVSGDRVIRIG